MRAAIVTGAFTPSHQSVATTVKHVVDAGVRQGHELIVIVPGHPLGSASYRGVRVVRPRPTDTTALSAAIREFAPDVVHLADPRLVGNGPARTAREAARAAGSVVVASHHSVGSDRWGEWWSTISDSGADLTLATCRAAQRALTDAGVAAALWRPGVDADLFTPAMRTPDLVERFSRGHQLVVGHVGDVSRPHVVRRLVDVGTTPGVRLVVARAGDGAARLRARLPRAKILEDVSGVDLAHVVASCDVLLQPRKKELDAHACRRALAAGVPVVALRAGGVVDVVTHECNGLLSDPRDRHGLRDAVRRLRDDRVLLGSLAAQARSSVTVRSWDDAVEELVETHWSSAVVRIAGSPDAMVASPVR